MGWIDKVPHAGELYIGGCVQPPFYLKDVVLIVAEDYTPCADRNQ